MWRKTRRPQNNSCIGVDANRNFGFHHAGKQQKTNPIISFFFQFMFFYFHHLHSSISNIPVEMGGSTNPCSEGNYFV